MFTSPYICHNCGEIFDEPRTYYEHHGFTDGLYEPMSCCPCCGGDYSEFFEEEPDEEVDEEE